MYNVEADTADNAWRLAVELIRDGADKQESRTFRSANTTETLELLHAGITIEDPRQRIVFGRPMNPAFAVAEVIWVLAGGNSVEFLSFWNPMMKKFSDDGKTLHGAYGHRLGCVPLIDMLDVLIVLQHNAAGSRFDQLHKAYNVLDATPHSRQVILQIWDSHCDSPHSDGAPTSKDVPCNVMADLKVRDGKLHWQQIMRSNDLIWGTPYDLFCWTTIQEVMAGWLGLEIGQYTHIASSLHVYEEHYEELAQIDTSSVFNIFSGADSRTVNHADLRIGNYVNWREVFKIVANAAVDITKAETADDVADIVERVKLDHKGYKQWICLLAAEACRRVHLKHLSCEELFNEIPGLIVGMGDYYAHSWMQWAKHMESKKKVAVV